MKSLWCTCKYGKHQGTYKHICMVKHQSITRCLYGWSYIKVQINIWLVPIGAQDVPRRLCPPQTLFVCRSTKAFRVLIVQCPSPLVWFLFKNRQILWQLKYKSNLLLFNKVSRRVPVLKVWLPLKHIFIACMQILWQLKYRSNLSVQLAQGVPFQHLILQSHSFHFNIGRHKTHADYFTKNVVIIYL